MDLDQMAMTWWIDINCNLKTEKPKILKIAQVGCDDKFILFLMHFIDFLESRNKPYVRNSLCLVHSFIQVHERSILQRYAEVLDCSVSLNWPLTWFTWIFSFILFTFIVINEKMKSFERMRCFLPVQVHQYNMNIDLFMNSWIVTYSENVTKNRNSRQKSIENKSRDQ